MPKNAPSSIDLRHWVEKGRHRSDLYQLRQVTEILITAIGMTPLLRNNLYLKGGALLAIAYESNRMTGDVDYTWLEPWDCSLDERIVSSLDDALRRAATALGYLDLICQIQSVEKQPHRDTAKPLSFPALTLRIGYARRGTNQELALAERRAANVLDVDISFNEPAGHSQTLSLADSNISVHAYAATEVVAEKLRALLQQTQRKHSRSRRQDIYDIDLLIAHCTFCEEEKRLIHESLLRKAKARDIALNAASFQDNAVKEAAQRDWNSNQLELETPLPDFDECYARVRAFYESLPW